MLSTDLKEPLLTSTQQKMVIDHLLCAIFISILMLQIQSFSEREVVPQFIARGSAGKVG